MTRKKNPLRELKRRKLCLAGLIASILLGSMTASDTASAWECGPGDVIHMNDPVVTVIEGPGDPELEQQRWANLANAYLEGHLEGPQSVILGDTAFDLEEVP